MIYDICIRKEVSNLQEFSNHRSGIEVMNYLFDLVNDVSGYTSKYYDETLLDHEELIKKYRAEKEANGSESPLLADNYPHSVMVLESV